MKRNRNFLIKLTMILAVLLILGTGSVFASNGDTINIGGVVPLILDLTVTPDTAADNLDLTVVGLDTSVTPTIATIDISTNNTAGWELWIYSTNAAFLTNDDNDTVAYTLSYGGTGGLATATTAPTTTGVLYGEAAAATTDTDALLTINYDQSESYPAGYYSDQLTVVLRAK